MLPVEYNKCKNEVTTRKQSEEQHELTMEIIFRQAETAETDSERSSQSLVKIRPEIFVAFALFLFQFCVLLLHFKFDT